MEKAQYAGRDMVAPGQAGALATLQIWKLLDHVFPKLILPPGQLLFIAHNIFGAKPAILGQRDKTKVHMGRFWSRYRQKYWIFTNSLTKKKGKLPMIDEWSGFADLLANLIEKYASELDVENLPAPAVSLEDQDSAAADKKESVFKPEAVAGKIAA